MLEISGLSKDFGGLRAVNRIDLSLAAGELLCIIGPNGCGKTTLFNLISGNLPSSEGSIRFGGAEVVGLRPHQVARLGIGRKFQVPSIYEDLSVADNLGVALFAKAGRRGVLGLAGHTSGGERRDALLERVGLQDLADQFAGHLSHGQRQWLEIGMVLATEPSMILLDEPTAGMTRAETERTSELVRAVQAEHGVAIILIEHDMWFVEALQCSVTVMMSGSIVATGDYDTVRQMDAVREAYLGTAHA